MIGKLKGILKEVEGNQGLVETASGVYYMVYLTPDIIKRYQIDESLEIYTYLHVKEDNLTLYGFDNKNKFQLFNMLLAVDGVGPKLAYGVISFTDSQHIIDAVTTSNHTFFSTIPGIGKKTAQKILLELSSEFDTEFKFEKAVLSQDDSTVIDALTALGFDRKSSHDVLDKLDKKASIETKIQQAIKFLTKKNN